MGAPWFKFYATDYLADSKVRMLTRVQRSVLIELWCYCAADGFVVANATQLARLLGETEETVTEIMVELASFFEEADGFLTSPRLNAETQSYAAKCDKLRANASKGGKAKAENALANAKPDAKAIVLAEPAEPEPEPEKSNTPIVPKGTKRERAKRGSAASSIMHSPEALAIFQQAWQIHPRRKDAAGNLRPAGNQAKGAAALQARIAEGITWDEVLPIEREYLKHPDARNGFAQNFEVFWGENGHWFGMVQLVRALGGVA